LQIQRQSRYLSKAESIIPSAFGNLLALHDEFFKAITHAFNNFLRVAGLPATTVFAGAGLATYRVWACMRVTEKVSQNFTHRADHDFRKAVLRDRGSDGPVTMNAVTAFAVKAALEAVGIRFNDPEKGVTGPGVALNRGVEWPISVPGDGPDDAEEQGGMKAINQDVADYWAANSDKWAALSGSAGTFCGTRCTAQMKFSAQTTPFKGRQAAPAGGGVLVRPAHPSPPAVRSALVPLAAGLCSPMPGTPWFVSKPGKLRTGQPLRPSGALWRTQA
jgi:hypothetical protein